MAVSSKINTLISHKDLLPKQSVAVVMITLNEAHNLEAVLDNIQDWAQEIYIVDSYSSDDTVDIALRRGVHVVQRAFKGFGDQWNYALEQLPIRSQWTMKLDPDERLSEELKASISVAIEKGRFDSFSITRRLWFMGTPLPIRQDLVRLWRTGLCEFTRVLVNEHPVVDGTVSSLSGFLEHHDSPNLHHWVEKQNQYSTMEALSFLRKDALSDEPKIFGTSFQRRMWFKKHFMQIPLRYLLDFMLNLIHVQVWKSGRIGYTWARLRVWTRRMKEDKCREMQVTGKEIVPTKQRLGPPHPKARQSVEI